MFRIIAMSLALACIASPAVAQTASPAAASKTARPKQPVKSAAKPTAPTASGPCHLGVISAIGDVFSVRKVALTVFGNESSEVPIGEWSLDDLVTARIRAAAGPHTTVRRITYAKGAFDPFENGPTKLFRNPQDDLTEVVRQVAANTRCARYAVITKQSGQVGSTNQGIRGVGVLNHGNSLFSRSFVFVSIYVTIYDGQSFAIRNKPSISLESLLSGALRTTSLRGPHREIDNAAYPDPAAQAVNSPVLRENARTLLTETLDKTLPALLVQ